MLFLRLTIGETVDHAVDSVDHTCPALSDLDQLPTVPTGLMVSRLGSSFFLQQKWSPIQVLSLRDCHFWTAQMMKDCKQTPLYLAGQDDHFGSIDVEPAVPFFPIFINHDLSGNTMYENRSTKRCFLGQQL